MFGRIPRVPQNIANLATASKDIIKNNRIEKKEYIKRINACKQCVYLLKAVDVCRKCGCFVKMKAMSPSMTCPIGKWSTSEITVYSTQDEGCSHDSDEVSTD